MSAPEQTPAGEHGQLGRTKRSTPTRGDLWLSRYLIPQFYDAPPPFDDWHGSVDYQWFGNDKLRNCTSVMIAHMLQQRCALIGEKCTLTLEQVIDHYSRATGYRPGESHTDTGGQNDDALKEARTNGIGDYKTEANLRVNVHDLVELKASLHSFGSVLVGANLPQRVFEQGDDWFVPVKRDARDVIGSAGGHAFLLTGYEKGWWYALPWRKRVRFPDHWLLSHIDEGSIVIDKRWVTKTRAAPNGFDLARLIHDFQAIGRTLPGI